MNWRSFLLRGGNPIVLVLALCVAWGCSHDDAMPNSPSFDACGGVLTGTWVIVDAEYDSEAAIERENARLSIACKATFKSVTLDAVGVIATFAPLASGSISSVANRVVYQRTLDQDIDVIEELVVSGPCVDEQFGGADCGAVGEALRTEGTAECSQGGPPCSCTASRQHAAAAPQTVVAEGGQMTTQGGDVYEFCREGDTLEQVERDADGALVNRLKLKRK